MHSPIPSLTNASQASAFQGCRRQRTFHLGSLCHLIGAGPAVLQAQTTGATLSGTVTDPAGRVVPGVDVIATNVDTHVESQTKTNGNRIYILPTLQPGHYRVIVNAQGFKRIVLADRSATLALALRIAAGHSNPCETPVRSLTPLVLQLTTHIGDSAF